MNEMFGLYIGISFIAGLIVGIVGTYLIARDAAIKAGVWRELNEDKKHH